MPERGYHLELITPVPLPRKPSGDLMRLPLRVRRAVRQTRAVLDDVDADVVIGFGGYVALPAYLAARGGPAPDGASPSSSTRPTRSAGLGQPGRRPVGAAGAVRGARPRAAPRRGGRRAGAGVDHLAGPDGAARRRPARTSASPTTPGCCWCSAARRAPSRSTGRSSAAAEDLAAAGISVLHAHGPKNTLELREPADG